MKHQEIRHLVLIKTYHAGNNINKAWETIKYVRIYFYT